jgi:prevent-host-death family protein
MDSIFPITRFNRGEAGKIFAEVSEEGFTIVTKNGTPVCVLVKPEQYDEMVEMLEDYRLFFEAEKRMKDAEIEGFLSQEQVLNHHGISESDLIDVDVDIE